MNENNKVAYNIRIVRDIAITIATVLVIISMVHKDYSGFYLGLPISNDNTNYGNFSVTVKGSGGDYDKPIKIEHENSCVNGQDFR